MGHTLLAAVLERGPSSVRTRGVGSDFVPLLCHTWLASVLARGPAIFETRAVGSNFGPRFVGDCFGQGAGYF